MTALSAIEPQRLGERVEHALRWVARAPLLEPDVVVDADTGELRQLLTAQPRHAASGGALEPELLGLDTGSPRPEELTHLPPLVHCSIIGDRRGGWLYEYQPPRCRDAAAPG